MPQTGLTSTTCDPPVPGEPQWTEEQHLAYLLASADIVVVLMWAVAFVLLCGTLP